ncbi:Mu transposase C-terminal domain-containing protein [Streptomyces sp. NPDC047079]|uniref:Mu transposase C-terminal domain-containing protein n=1 Tax=Streptomyces sp. NPDC047079 TaxID=3154607 RepID=UPI0034012D05
MGRGLTVGDGSGLFCADRGLVGLSRSVTVPRAADARAEQTRCDDSREDVPEPLHGDSPFDTRRDMFYGSRSVPDVPVAGTAPDRDPAISSHSTSIRKVRPSSRLRAEQWSSSVHYQLVELETKQAIVRTPGRREGSGSHDRPGPLPPAARSRAAGAARLVVERGRRATVSLHSNIYNVDPALVGRKVELIFDPFDLAEIEVRFQNRPFGLAVPHRISRHAHPKARPEIPEAPPAPSTGIDYLRLIDTARTSELGQKIDYTALMPRQDEPGRHA